MMSVVLFIASSSWCEVLTVIWTVPSRRNIYPVWVCHITILDISN